MKPPKKRISYQLPLGREFGNGCIYPPFRVGVYEQPFLIPPFPIVAEVMGISGVDDIEKQDI